MHVASKSLSAAEAASRLGVSPKALRLYEQRGLISPERTAAGYRAYTAGTLHRAAQVVRLRALGMGMAQVAKALAGDAAVLEEALALQMSALEHGIQAQTRAIRAIRDMRAELAQGRVPAPQALSDMLSLGQDLAVGFDLPWPWGGEWFEVRNVQPLNYIVGPLGSGKTRLAMQLAEKLPDTVFLGLDRLAETPAGILGRLAADTALDRRVQHTLAAMQDEGAGNSHALTTLVAGLETPGPRALVIDMVEQGLDQQTQEALIRHLRRQARHGARVLFMLTRSSSILDLQAAGPGEAIIYCPANHSPPMHVAPHPGVAGFDAVQTCLGTPAARARTAGMEAHMPVLPGPTLPQRIP
jgi:DNA-binding transcriptional MerR regulator